MFWIYPQVYLPRIGQFFGQLKRERPLVEGKSQYVTTTIKNADFTADDTRNYARWAEPIRPKEREEYIAKYGPTCLTGDDCEVKSNSQFDFALLRLQGGLPAYTPRLQQT
ncbi:MAG: hypothetical protein C4332_02360 [Meiothermus sp.]